MLLCNGVAQIESLVYQEMLLSSGLTNSIPINAMGNPSQLIQSRDTRPLIQTPSTVKDVLNRLHNREKDLDTIDTQDETSTANNDRLVSDTLSDSAKSKTKKKKNIMTIT